MNIFYLFWFWRYICYKGGLQMGFQPKLRQYGSSVLKCIFVWRHPKHKKRTIYSMTNLHHPYLEQPRRELVLGETENFWSFLSIGGSGKLRYQSILGGKKNNFLSAKETKKRSFSNLDKKSQFKINFCCKSVECCTPCQATFESCHWKSNSSLIDN